MFAVMVAEDDKNTRKLMCTILSQNGYDAVPAVDGVDALKLLDRQHIDLILLDIMMPRMDGYEFVRTLRDGGCNIPVLMVTAKETSADKIAGFRAGTDDYMVKPFDEEEMLLRIAALLRRSNIASEHRITAGGTVLDYDSASVSFGDTVLDLPNKEFRLLFLLLSYPGKIFTRRHLMDELWDMESESDERTVDVHINRLREKFKDNEDFEIVTARGLGYKAVIKAKQ